MVKVFLDSRTSMRFLQEMIRFRKKHDDDFEDMMFGKNLTYKEIEKFWGKEI